MGPPMRPVPITPRISPAIVYSLLRDPVTGAPS